MRDDERPSHLGSSRPATFRQRFVGTPPLVKFLRSPVLLGSLLDKDNRRRHAGTGAALHMNITLPSQAGPRRRLATALKADRSDGAGSPLKSPTWIRFSSCILRGEGI
jgi:hypothetical protein